MDMNALLVFVEVARLGSFKAAAEHLELSTTNVSNKVKQLEEQLNTSLIHRSTRAVSLTETGQQVFDRAQQITADAKDILEFVTSQSSEPQGRLRIAAPSSVTKMVLAQWLIEFRMLYPKVYIDVISTNRYLDFLEDRLDFAFRLGTMPDSSLIGQKLFDVQCGPFASPDLIAQFPPLTHPRDLADWPCIALSVEGQPFPWEFQENGEPFTFTPESVLCFEELELAQLAATAGAGVAHISFVQADEEVRSGRLLPLLVNYWPRPLRTHLVYARRDFMAAKNQSFLDFILHKCEELKPMIRELSTVIEELTDP